MALKKLVSDLTQGLVAYPNHNVSSDTGGYNYGQSTSIFDTKSFNQRSMGYSDKFTSQLYPTPLIPQILPEVNAGPDSSILYLNNAPDGFIRGGATNATIRTAVDSIRMNQFFDTAEGITFINTQTQIQKTNPIIQEGGRGIEAVGGDILEFFIGTDLGFGVGNNGTNRVFNIDNIKKQIENNYLGVYYDRAGTTSIIPDGAKYWKQHGEGKRFDSNEIGTFSTRTGLENGNRLLSLAKKFNSGMGAVNIDEPGSFMSEIVGFDVGDVLNVFDSIKDGFNNFKQDPIGTLSGKFNGDNILYQYNGGPSSIYGIGDTILYKYESTSGDLDHQGFPLSLSEYWKKHPHQVVSLDSNDIFGLGGVEDMLFNSLNNNIFGGVNILGGDSIFRGDDGTVSIDSIIEGGATQLFGEETVDFFKNLLGSEDPSGAPKDPNNPTGININTLSGGVIPNPILSYLTGFPNTGYIATGTTNVRNRDDKTATSAPTSEAKTRTKSRVIWNPTDPSRYKPNHMDISKEGRAIEGNQVGNIENSTHYYTKIGTTTVNGTNKSFRREERVNIGDPGANFFNLSTQHDAQGKGIDLINQLDVVYDSTDDVYADAKYRDLIDFRFDIVQTDTPSQWDSLFFRAFLDDFGDNYNANWNEFQYNGRGESFYTYNNFKRTVSFSFKIAAQSRHELHPLYKKLNYLASSLAPDYGEGGRMRGTYVKLTIGDYLTRTPGILTSIAIKWKTDYPWEITIDMPENGSSQDLQELPHILDVSCQFTPIHNFVPRKSNKDDHAPFISNQSWLNKAATPKENAANFTGGLGIINPFNDSLTSNFNPSLNPNLSNNLEYNIPFTEGNTTELVDYTQQGASQFPETNDFDITNYDSGIYQNNTGAPYE